jgi:hypothetical protein
MLIRTSQSENHYHIGYIRPDKSGVTSFDKGHSHNISTSVSPETGEPLTVIQATDHTHEIIEFGEFESKPIKPNPDDEVEICKALYREGRRLDIDSRSLDDARIAEEFYMGNQWDPAVVSKLDKKNRCHVTINEIAPKVNLLWGKFVEQRTDIKLLPTETGDARTADVLNYRIKNILTRENWISKEFRIHGELLRTGRGVGTVTAGIDRNNTLNVSLDCRAWDSTFFGPHAEPDASDAEYAGFFTDVSKARLKELYPDKIDEIEDSLQEMLEAVDNSGSITENNRYPTSDSRPATKPIPTGLESDLADIAQQVFRLVELQRRIYKHTPIVFNSRHGFFYSIDGVPKVDLSKIDTIEELSKVTHASYEVWITVIAGDVLLRSEKSLLPEIGIVPFYCNKIGARWWGKIFDALDPQRMLNKHHSMTIDIIGHNSMYGLGVSQSAFENTKDYDKFVQTRSESGFTFKFADNFQEHLKEFQGARFPTEQANIAQLSSDKIYSVMNVNPQMMGISTQSQESGASLVHKQRQGFLGNAYIMENIDASKARIGFLILKCIQAIDSPERLLRLTENQDNRTLAESDKVQLYPESTPQELIAFGIEKKVINPQVFAIIQQTQQIPPEIQQALPQLQQLKNKEIRDKLLAILDNYEITDYDVTVYESPWSPTAKFSNFLLLSELFKGNPNAPYKMLIQEMPFMSQDVKDQLISEISAQQEAQMEMERQKMQTELMKPVIANQAKATTGTPGQTSQ